jgi:hypothetical protein
MEECGKKLKKRTFGKTEANGEALFLDDSLTMEISKEKMHEEKKWKKRRKRKKRMEKIKKGVYFVTVLPCE